MLNNIQHQYQNIKFCIVFNTFDILNNFIEQNKIEDDMFILSSKVSRSKNPNNFLLESQNLEVSKELLFSPLEISSLTRIKKKNSFQCF